MKGSRKPNNPHQTHHHQHQQQMPPKDARFTVTALLGQGTFGSVFAATQGNAKFAIKRCCVQREGDRGIVSPKEVEVHQLLIERCDTPSHLCLLREHFFTNVEHSDALALNMVFLRADSTLRGNI